MSIDTSKLIQTLLKKFSLPKTDQRLLILTVDILKQATNFLHSRKILMSLNVHKVLLDLVTSPLIERKIKLRVFDCLLNILKDHENIEVLLLEEALVIFADMLRIEGISVEEIIKCLRGRNSNFSYLFLKFESNFDSN